ncbi:MAG TPA: acylphosphatase [Anaerolineaceae bacterium]|nr:acylphosphatase [Anaerolineaceae bacterium]
MSSEGKACLHAIVEGRVQGVGFRAFVYDHAEAMGLTGWVRNRGEDQVEVWAEGPASELDKFLALLRQGPRMSYVAGVEVSHPAPEGKYSRFMVISSTY